MHDYRLLLPALVFWIVRIGVIEPAVAVSISAVLLVSILYLASIQIDRRNLTVTAAGVVLAVVLGIAVNTILPVNTEKFADNFGREVAEIPSGMNRTRQNYTLPNAKTNYDALKNTAAQNDTVQEVSQDFAVLPQVQTVVMQMRQNFQVLTQKYSSETGGILRGVVLGDDSLIPDGLSTAVRLSGLQHLVAISGAHISLLIGMAVFLLGRRKPKLTAILAGIFLCLLIALVGLSASVLRAALMGTTALSALAFQRGSGAVAALSIGIIAGAAFWPELAESVGFQMSVLATASIVIFVPWLRKIPLIARHGSLQLGMVSLVAGTAVIPVSLHLQPELSVLTTPANIAVAPVIPLMTVLGLLAAVISVLNLQFATLLLIPCACGAWWVARIAEFVAAIKIFLVSPWIVAALQLVALVGIVLWAKVSAKTGDKEIKFAPQQGKAKNLQRLLAVSFAAGAVISFLLIPRFTRAADGFVWEFVQCDVGQGAALLARNAQQTILIDTGTEKNNAVACLRRNKVERLDLLVLSHLDADHAGGFAQVAQTVQLRKVWLSKNTYPQERYAQILDLAAEQNISVELVASGAQFSQWVRVVSPQTVRGSATETNADSLVLDLDLRTHRVLVLSDVPQAIQERIAQMHLGHFSCVIVAHHGAKSQSALLAAQLKPDISLISVGKNRYGHPHKNALQVWSAPLLKTTRECGEIRIGAREYDTQKSC